MESWAAALVGMYAQKELCQSGYHSVWGDSRGKREFFHALASVFYPLRLRLEQDYLTVLSANKDGPDSADPSIPQ